MIIAKNKSKKTPIYILRNNIDKVQNTPTADVDLSDYYNKGEVDELIANVEVDLTDYYTKGEVDDAIANVDVDLSGYATESWVNDNYQTRGDYLTEIPDEYVTEEELGNKGYATETYVDNKVDNIVIPDSSNIVSLTTAEYEELVNSGEVDSDTMYLITDAEFSANFKTINGESILGDGNIEITGGGSVDLSKYYTKTEIDGKGYATESWVNTQIGNINNALENLIG